MLLALLFSVAAWGQVSITNSNTLTENFDGIGSTSTAMLPSGWRVDSVVSSPTTVFSSAATSTTQAAGTTGTGVFSSSSAGGTYNLANGITASSTERAVGWLSSGSYSSPRQLFVQLTNNSGQLLTALTITFDIEKYRSGIRAFDINFFSSADGSTWVAQTAGNQSFSADANNTTVSNPPVATNKSVTISGLSVANGSSIYLRWAYIGSGGSTNGQALGIDNVTFTPTLAPDTATPVISYTPLSSTATATSPTLAVMVTDNVGVGTVQINYTVRGASVVTGMANCSSGGGATYNCMIDDSAIDSAGIVEYYVTASDAAGNSASQPAAANPNVYTVGNGWGLPGGTYTDLRLGTGNVSPDGISVTGSLTLEGVVNVPDPGMIDMGCDTILSGGSAANYVTGKLKRNFCGAEMFVYQIGTPSPGALNGVGANEYRPVTVNVTAVTGASSLTVASVSGFMFGVDANQALSRHWTIDETGDITADLLFKYEDADVVGDESGYELARHEVIMGVNHVSRVLPFTLDTAANTISTTGVMTFSNWTGGKILGPTAAGVSIAGTVRNFEGNPLRNATVVLIDPSAGEQGSLGKVATDRAGGFQFNDVEAGRFYLIRVFHRRYQFVERLVFIGSDLDGLDFTGQPLGQAAPQGGGSPAKP